MSKKNNNISSINLNQLVISSLKGKAQAIVFNSDGNIILSDEGLISILGSDNNIYDEPAFFGLDQALELLDFEEDILLGCIETSFFNRSSNYDFHLKRITKDGDDKLFSLIVYDLSDQYTAILELRQERNNAEIHAQQLKKAHQKLDEALQREIESNRILQETQSQLVHSEKMASLGQLTSGMGHEINNPLNFIHNGSILLRQKIDSLNSNKDIEVKKIAGETQSFLDIIENGSERIRDVIKDLQLFNGNNDKEFILSDLHSNLDATISLISYQLLGDTQIDRNYSSKIKKIRCIPGKLNQAVMNILKNSIQSIPKNHRGEILISTDITANSIIISVKDNGRGISPDHFKKIFTPFFTTLDVGKGKGLGLSICNSIITEHSGTISFTSVVNSGTEFFIELPKA